MPRLFPIVGRSVPKTERRAAGSTGERRTIAPSARPSGQSAGLGDAVRDRGARVPGLIMRVVS